MEKNNNNFYMILVCSFVISSIIFNCWFIKYQIERHSVHPVYGIYQQKTYGCDPWDSCKHCDSSKCITHNRIAE